LVNPLVASGHSDFASKLRVQWDSIGPKPENNRKKTVKMAEKTPHFKGLLRSTRYAHQSTAAP